VAGALAVARGLGSSEKLSAPTSLALPFEPVTHRSQPLLQSFAILLPMRKAQTWAARSGPLSIDTNRVFKLVVSIT
jgi:hypothetical protein